MSINWKKYFEARTYFPKGITGRILVLIILPIMFTQILTGYMFYNRHWKPISNQSAMIFAGNVLAVIDLKNTNENFSELEQIAKKNFMMDVEWIDGKKIPPKHKNSKRLEKLSLKYVYRFLNQNVKKPYTLFADETKNVIEIQVQYPTGILAISSPLKNVFSKTFYIFFIWMIGSALVFVAIAIPFAKNQVKAIKKLTRAIIMSGRGEDIKWFNPTGPIQVRRAGEAFLKTYDRIQRYVQSKTNMLSGISHDLKTPLTRMKLELEFSDDKNLQFALLNDIEDMEKMIDSYLNYSKGVPQEISEKVNITKTVLNLVRKLNKGNFDINFEAKKDYFAIVKPVAFERAISNVIVNAIRYGNKKIDVAITGTKDSVEIVVEDNGNGIPEDKREDMFRPFTRLDDSRNAETGGVGLGLSIVQEIVHQHGGNVMLLDGEKLGGLKVMIQIPIKD